MDERDFIEWYCNDSAFDIAVNFYTGCFPVIYAGYVDNGYAIFYVTQEDPNYEYECSIVSLSVVEEYGASNEAWHSNGDYLININGANSFDEIADILAPWLN